MTIFFKFLFIFNYSLLISIQKVKAYITVNKKEIQQRRFNYTEALKALSEEFVASHEALIFSPMPGKLIDVVNHLAENQISYHLDFSRDDNKTEKLLFES
jgi:hypothetical protein